MDPTSFGKRGHVLALLSFCLLFALAGCAKRADLQVETPSPVSPGYAAQGYAPPAEPGPTTESRRTGGDAVNEPARVVTADATKSAPTSAPPPPAKAESSGGIFSMFRSEKSEAKAASGAQPPGQPAAPPPPPPPPPPGAPPKADPTQQAAQQRELIIYTARVTMAVFQVDQGVAAVEKIAVESGGYLATKQDRGITIRVPRARFQDTLTKVDKIGDVLHRDVQAQDVTDEHLDLEIRIKNARAMRARLQDLLAKANVKEALEIEKELHRVTEELERLEGKLKLLADKVAYSTITVAFEPRGSTIRAASVRLPFPWLTQVGLPGLLQLNEEK